MAPRCAFTKDLTTAKPKPVPPCARAVVKNGSNTRAALAAEMPGPLSLTSMIRVAAIPVRGAGQATVMVAVSPPCCRALSSRLLKMDSSTSSVIATLADIAGSPTTTLNSAA